MALILLGAGLLLMPSPRLPTGCLRVRDGRAARGTDLDFAARLLLVAVSSGLPLSGALELVTAELRGPVAAAIESVVRRSRVAGLGRALLDAPDVLRPLAQMIARAHVSGASVQSALEAFVERRRRTGVAVAATRARRTGVLLVLPLALLLLPGFGLIVFGPYVVGHLNGLSVGP